MMKHHHAQAAAGLLLFGCLAAAGPLMASEQPASPDKPDRSRAITRLFFQSPEDGAVRWADLLSGEPIQLTEPQQVEGFPQLDPDRQRLVQMAAAGGLIMLGVRDDEEGEFQSGWILIDSGIEVEHHIDHYHWYYTAEPRVIASRLDASQGNPAHLYVYDDVFYLANDRIGGFTRLDPRSVAAAVESGAVEGDEGVEIASLATFHRGGNGHITLAVSGDVALATWMSRDEETARRIDVTPLGPGSNGEVAWSFDALSDRLHGATAAENKVFFAPRAGINWIELSAAGQLPTPPPDVHHIDLGSDGQQPYRTGSFTTLGPYVLFVSGQAEDTFLGLIDARQEAPELIKVDIEVAAGSRAHGPKLVQSRVHGPLAVLFHDHAADVDAPHVASVIRLDPNRDGDFSDAAVWQTIDVGPSSVIGHSGHHSLAVDALSRYVVIANPGDATLQVLSTIDLSPRAEFSLPFAPERMVGFGGPGPIR